MDGSLAMDLPGSLLDLYSEAYGRYSYAVIDETGNVLFSSHGNGSQIFIESPRSSQTTLLTTRKGSKAISGVEFAFESAGRKIWVQVGEDLAHRDVPSRRIVNDVLQGEFYGPLVGSFGFHHAVALPACLWREVGPRQRGKG